MANIIRFKRILAYCQGNNGYYYDLSGDTSIIHGANTSGKSTLVQTILYAMGINDMNKYLDTLYNRDSQYTIRLDAEIHNNGTGLPITFVRNDGFLKLKIGENPTIEFNGISSDSSAEHIRLKEYLRKLLGYDLKLFQVNEYKDASIETLLLPYYICQSVGWVSIRKTFDGLDFYRNFRESFIDYCTGIAKANDMEERDRIEKEIRELQTKIEAFESAKESNNERKIELLKSDLMVSQCTTYVENFKEKEHALQDLHYEYTKLCEKLSFLNIRKQVLKSTKKSLRQHNHNGISACPLCGSQIGNSIEGFYNHQQDLNDTNQQMLKVETEIKSLSRSINQIKKKIDEQSKKIEDDRMVMQSLVEDKTDITFNDWLNSQVHAKLNDTLDGDIKSFQTELKSKTEELKQYRTDDQIKNERLTVSGMFKTLFKSYLEELHVDYTPYLEENRYFDVYKISALPYQGVELLKAMMAYHFAFNKLVKEKSVMPRFPFILDAIFKEDIEDENKRLILQFIKNNRPADTQLIFSMADTENLNNQIDSVDVNNTYFGGSANLIQSGSGPRSLIKDLSDDIIPLIEDTEDL